MRAFLEIDVQFPKIDRNLSPSKSPMKIPGFFPVHAIAIIGIIVLSPAGAVEVTSPDGKVRTEFQIVDGVPAWQVEFEGKPLLERGLLGVAIGGAGRALGRLEETAAEVTTQRERVETTWGKFAAYDDHYRRLEWSLREMAGNQRTIRIIARVYNSGVALRYAFAASDGWTAPFILQDDRTEFRFAEDFTAWAYVFERDPQGPQPLSKFRENGKGSAQLPLTLRAQDGTHLAVLEGAIFDHAPFLLKASNEGNHGFRASLSPSKLEGDSQTSWRVLLLGRKAGDLLVSPMPYCLNPPCKIEDTSWIKPGLAMWDWRAWGAKGSDGFVYGLDMPSWRRFIDFASSKRISYLVLDAGWYGHEFDKNSNPRTSRDYLLVQPDPDNPRLVPQDPPADWKDPIDVPGLIQYAKQRNVGIFLYFNDLARDHGSFGETLALYRKWGAAGIKYGFMKGSGQEKVRKTREIVELCAKYQLHCNFHDGPVAPSGDSRTWPNYLTREFCHSQSDATRVFSPTGFCEQIFVNMLAGPLDMCNGLYTLKNPAAVRPKIFRNLNTTIVAETARTMITFSGMSILPDSPDAYQEHADLFDYLASLPMTWDETRIVHGEIGEFITTVRRSGKHWFIASATNEEARTLPIRLDFLDLGTSYTATLYEDAPDAHFKTHREAYRIRRLKVKHGDTIEAVMAPGGGHCVRLVPEG